MSEENKAILRRYFDEAWNKGNLLVVDELFTDDYMTHSTLSPGGPVRGPEEVKQFISRFRTAFPDLSVEVNDMLAEDAKAVTLFTLRGTQKSEFMGIQSKGNTATVTAMVIWRIENGKIAEGWNVNDGAGLPQQLTA